MSDNQARIAELIRPWLRRQRDAEDLAELVAQLVYPRIETVEQLDALPIRSVVRDADGDTHEMDDCGFWRAPRYPSILNAVRLPARLLFNPEVDR
ncbi:hypothetical protein KL864_27165 [Mycolicibacterium goodii]|uniref:hypothetical protein n=1 Tax=Mycolicibacterium goodii TaxID=134601 RepID=UPI001BDCDB2D|nr:hypothetical protein [Mycolicibacterium goodii]MBU8819571.1 hypothetical protein [Mycolicibacterium goodii]